MKLIDVSRTIAAGSVVIPGDAPLGTEEICEIAPGCPCRITGLKGWSTHFLTHVDAPRHFIANGKTLDELPLERFVCDALVVAVPGPCIGRDHVRDLPNLRGMAVLFKTANSAIATDAPFAENYAYADAEAAAELVRKQANLVGVDYLTIDRHGDDSYPAHNTLLGEEILILEGLDLTKAKPGSYRLSALPMKIAGGDGSPVRAILS